MVLKKVISKGWCKESNCKTFVNILHSLLKLMINFNYSLGTMGDTMTFSVYIGSVYFYLFILFNFILFIYLFIYYFFFLGGGGVKI